MEYNILVLVGKELKGRVRAILYDFLAFVITESFEVIPCITLFSSWIL